MRDSGIELSVNKFKQLNTIKKKKCFGKILALGFITALIYYGNQYYSDKTNKAPLRLHDQKSNTRQENSNVDVTPGYKSVRLRQEDILGIRSIISLPTWFCSENQTLRLKEDKSLEKLKVKTRRTDTEEITAWENFFYGTSGGLMLELGAVAGKASSVSYFLEASAHWRVILIEGNLNLASHLAENRAQALNINVAICDKPGPVHFISKRGVHGVSGILEYMSQEYFKTFYSKLLKYPRNETLDWEKVKADKRVRLIQCLPLANILTSLKINHLNFFVLDVDGGEHNILKSIDFSRISFDVITVDTHRRWDEMNYTDAVSELLTSKGYLLWRRKLGKNSWFVHPDFKLSVKPKAKKLSKV